MKSTKALKRILKIEALLSNVIDKYSAGGPQAREALQKAEVALAQAKQAVEADGSSAKKKASRPAGAQTSPSTRTRTERAAAEASRTRRKKPRSATVSAM